MKTSLEDLVVHEQGEHCPVCQAQELVHLALLPAAAAWEANNDLPRYSVALNGAAELLGVLLEQGFRRDDVETALGRLLDDIELRIAEDNLGGPAQGSA